MHGRLNTSGFAHFDYMNPQAPKGGSLYIAAATPR
jgi:ABC-type oligopeptide transport system substrate-binding subunit